MHPATPIPRWVLGLKSVDNLVEGYSKIVHLTVTREFRRISNILSMFSGFCNTMRKMLKTRGSAIPMLPSLGFYSWVLVITVKKFLTFRIASSTISDACNVSLRFPYENNANFRSILLYLMRYFSVTFFVVFLLFFRIFYSNFHLILKFLFCNKKKNKEDRQKNFSAIS